MADRSVRDIQANDEYTITGYPMYAAVVTPSDTVDLANPGVVRANAAGTIVVIPQGNADASTITLTLAAGEVVPCLVRRVKSTGTTATPLHVFY